MEKNDKKSSFEVQKQLDELYKTGNLDLAWDLLEQHFYGELDYSTAAQDLVTRINLMAKENKTSPKECAEVIESVIGHGRYTKNPQTWRWTADAQYALRILAENQLFSDITYFEDSVEKPRYNQAGIEMLANKFNKSYADREYSIGRFSYIHPKTKETIVIDPLQKAA